MLLGFRDQKPDRDGTGEYRGRVGCEGRILRGGVDCVGAWGQLEEDEEEHLPLGADDSHWWGTVCECMGPRGLFFNTKSKLNYGEDALRHGTLRPINI